MPSVVPCVQESTPNFILYFTIAEGQEKKNRKNMKTIEIVPALINNTLAKVKFEIQLSSGYLIANMPVIASALQESDNIFVASSRGGQRENLKNSKTPNMQIAKIIQKFYSKTQAQAHVQYLRAKAKKENVLIAKIEIVNAYDLYVTNNWFKKRPFKNLGSPSVDTYMVLVHRTANVIAPVEVKKIQQKIKKAVANNRVRSSFYIVKLAPSQINEIEKSKIASSSYSLSKTFGFQYKHLTSCAPGRNKMLLSLHPLDMHYSLAA